MKLIFKIMLMFCSLNTHAFIINIYHFDSLEQANLVKEIFNKKYKVPNRLISTKKSKCLNVDKRMLNLCITKKGKLKLLPSNIKFLNKSLKVFRTSQNEVLI